MKALLRVLAILFVFFGATLHGQYSDYSEDCCDPCPTSGCRVPCFPYSCRIGLAYINAQVLCLKACEGRYKRSNGPNFQWNAGYRFAVGCEFQESPWEMLVAYTTFHASSNCKRFKLFEFDERRNSHWGIHLKYADFILAYRTTVPFLPCNVSFKPYLGLRAAAINQKLTLPFFENSIISSSALSSSFKRHIERDRLRQQLNGVGLIIGVEAIWLSDCGFSYYINGDIGNLIGRCHVSKRVRHFAGSHLFKCHSNDGQQQGQLFVDSGFGVKWKTCICGNLNMILQLGYEFHRFFNYNQLYGCSDLCVQGGAFSASLEY